MGCAAAAAGGCQPCFNHLPVLLTVSTAVCAGEPVGCGNAACKDPLLSQRVLFRDQVVSYQAAALQGPRVVTTATEQQHVGMGQWMGLIAATSH